VGVHDCSSLPSTFDPSATILNPKRRRSTHSFSDAWIAKMSSEPPSAVFGVYGGSLNRSALHRYADIWLMEVEMKEKLEGEVSLQLDWCARRKRNGAQPRCKPSTLEHIPSSSPSQQLTNSLLILLPPTCRSRQSTQHQMIVPSKVLRSGEARGRLQDRLWSRISRDGLSRWAGEHMGSCAVAARFG
jgi:hypothetical protein